MLKHLHMLLAGLVCISFISRVLLTTHNPGRWQSTWLKIAPHALDSLLLLTGLALIHQGHWLATDPTWLIGKILVVFIYIILGRLAMRSRGLKRVWAGSAAVFCLIYIAKIALSKSFFDFF